MIIMERKLKIKQYEVVLSIENMTDKDELYLMMLEVSEAWRRASITNIGVQYERRANIGIVQFYVPIEVFDEEMMMDIGRAAIGNRLRSIDFDFKK